MTESEFHEIKSKMKALGDKMAESKGKMAAIKEGWKAKYGFDDLESAKAKLDELKGDADAKRAKRSELMDKLESSFDWEKFSNF